MIDAVDSAARPPRPSRSDSREAMELRALKERQPELADAVDMHLELLEVQRRVQGRIPLPHVELSAEIVTRHQAEARPLLRFEDIPLELSDLRLVVRQTADILRRFGALDDADYQQVQDLGRDMTLVEVIGGGTAPAPRSTAAPDRRGAWRPSRRARAGCSTRC